MKLRNTGWFMLVTGLLAIAAAYLLLGAAVSGQAPALLMIYGVGSTLAGPLLLASPGRAVPVPLLVAASTVLIVVCCGFLIGLWWPAETAQGPLLFGLPFRAAIVLVGVGLVPALVLPWAYARAASRENLDPESIRVFVAECRTLRPEGSQE